MCIFGDILDLLPQEVRKSIDEPLVEEAWFQISNTETGSSLTLAYSTQQVGSSTLKRLDFFHWVCVHGTHSKVPEKIGMNPKKKNVFFSGKGNSLNQPICVQRQNQNWTLDIFQQITSDSHALAGVHPQDRCALGHVQRQPIRHCSALGILQDDVSFRFWKNCDEARNSQDKYWSCPQRVDHTGTRGLTGSCQRNGIVISPSVFTEDPWTCILCKFDANWLCAFFKLTCLVIFLLVWDFYW